MAYLKFPPDLLLGVPELNRLKNFVDDNGFRKNILDNSVSFGLIKNSRDFLFANGRVERDLDNNLGQKTVKVRELNAIDKFGNFIHLPVTNGIAVPNDGNWYWLKVAYAVSNLEKGQFSISQNGDLVDGSGNAELTKLFRGMPDFPTRIRFSNSVYNTLEYDVLDVIDDQHATLQHPATNSNGISEFTAESNLTIEIVGTFTHGISVPNTSKMPFNYDSATVSLVQESFSNTPPATLIKEVEFYLARVKVTSSNVVIQDKRLDYWETKGSKNLIEIDRAANPLIGVESVQYNSNFSPSDRNIVKLAWGIRSDNFSIDSSNNTVTFNSGLGGRYKTVNDFQNGDLVGGRLYAPNGQYRKITGSVKQGSAINFQVDVLDVDDFSPDGGTTLIAGTLIAVPDCEEVEILFTPDPADNVPAIQEAFTFPVTDLVGRCDVLVYKDPSVLYNVKYRYKSHREYTDYKAIPTESTVGYFQEVSFDDNGNLKVSGIQRYQYVSDAVNGFIQLNLSPNAISKFRNKVDKGDIIDVREINSLANTTTINFVVGTDANYIHLTGNIVLPNDVYFNLDRGKAIKGNEFRFHFDCTALDLSGSSIYIVQDFGAGTQKILKQIKQGDVYQMFNQEGGLLFDCKFDGNNWLMYQNYDLGRPYEVVQIDGVIANLFDSQSGLGKTKGLFGYVVCDQQRTVDGVNVPDLKKRFLVSADAGTAGYTEGSTAGAAFYVLTQDNLPSVVQLETNASGATGAGAVTDGNGDQNSKAQVRLGKDKPIDTVPPYYALIFAKKVF